MTQLEKCRLAEGAIRRHLVLRLVSERLVSAHRARQLSKGALADVFAVAFRFTPQIAVPVAGEMLVFQPHEFAQ